MGIMYKIRCWWHQQYKWRDKLGKTYRCADFLRNDSVYG